jgi:uridine kinase
VRIAFKRKSVKKMENIDYVLMKGEYVLTIAKLNKQMKFVIYVKNKSNECK